MSDRLARALAATALAVALVALVVAGFAVDLGRRYLRDVRAIGQLLERATRPGTGPSGVPAGPPPRLDPGDE